MVKSKYPSTTVSGHGFMVIVYSNHHYTYCRNCIFHCLVLNKKCFIFCLCMCRKFCIFAIQFQQLPRSVIDWGTIKNILLSDENNARNIYNTLFVSSFIYNQALLAFISRWLWCSLRYLTLAFYSRVFDHTFHFGFQFGITAGFRDLWNYGSTESRNYGSYAKTTSRAEPANS